MPFRMLYSPKTEDVLVDGFGCRVCQLVQMLQSLKSHIPLRIVGDKIAKLRRAYPCGNVKSNCNFVFHNGERKEITCHTLNAMLLCTRIIVCLFSLPVLSFLSNVCTICTSLKMTCARFHSYVISFLSPLWKTKLQLDFTLPQG